MMRAELPAKISHIWVEHCESSRLFLSRGLLFEHRDLSTKFSGRSVRVASSQAEICALSYAERVWAELIELACDPNVSFDQLEQIAVNVKQTINS
jgi:hypothetical protein